MLRRYVTLLVVVALDLPRRPAAAQSAAGARRARRAGTGSGSPSTPSSARPCPACRWRPTTRGTRARCATPSWAPSSGTRSRRSPATRIGLIALVTVADGRRRADLQRVHRRAARHAGLRASSRSASSTSPSSTPTRPRCRCRTSRPRWDRRLLAIVLGALATVFALALEHQRLRELPDPDRLGVRAAARRARRRLLRASRAGSWDLAEQRRHALARCSCRGWSASSPTS